MLKRFPGIILILLLCGGAAYGEYDPPPGSAAFYDLHSPFLLGGGVTSVSPISPVGDVMNPAASGALQRFTLDFSYLTLFGTGEEDGFGQAINLGFSKPFRAGVLSGSAHFITSPLDSVDLGTIGSFNLSFAKDLFPQLLVGAGVDAIFGGDWGLAADLGFLHLAGPLGPFPDFRWGGVLRGLGKGYEPDSEYSAFPAPFTPALGVQLGLMADDTFRWAAMGDASFPSCQNARFVLGTQLTYKSFLSFQASSTLDLYEIAEGESRDLPLACGVTVQFATAISQDQTEVKATLAAAPLQNGIWAAGAGANISFGVIDNKPPAITVGSDTVYISPNFDGIQDDLIRPIRITDERFIKGYRLSIADGSGKIVREIVNKDERPENVTFKNIVDRLLYVKTGISVPEALRWDGKSDAGVPVPDGSYSYQLEAWDDNGNHGSSAKGTVVVDTVPPQVEVKAPYLIFSPNNDGNKDSLPVEQAGSVEDLWEGEVLEASGKTVAAFQWKESEPRSFSWDGKASAGVLAADGVYSYRISTRDRAGNSGGARLDNILIDTQQTPILVTINESFISPNGDGVKDTVRFNLDVPVKRGIEHWSLTIRDSRSEQKRVLEGTNGIPERIEYDGTDASGRVLPEGTYLGALEVRYVNGNQPKAESPGFTVDLTPPSASVTSDLAIFSPNGDGNKDAISFFQEASEEPLWTGSIEDESGKTVRSFTWRGRPEARLVWNGQGGEGKLLADGRYSYLVRATDRAGNSGASQKLFFELNTEETPVLLSADQELFSPNADGVKDRVTINPSLKVTAGVEEYELRILDGAGQVVRSLKNRNRAPEPFAWDGQDNAGRRAPDGSYAAELILTYQKGDHHEVRTAPFSIDTKPPELAISAEYTLFSPDGDDLKDAVEIRQSSSREDLFEGEVLDGKGKPVRLFFWKQEASSFKWDGTDDNGNRLPDGLYSYRVRCTDRAGNSSIRELKSLQIDTRPTTVFLTVAGDGFSPNGDGFLDDLELKSYVGLAEGIREWRLEMVHAQDGVVRTIRGAAGVPAELRWDGKTDAGAVREGGYTARLTVEYLKGNRPQASSTPFILDSSPPLATITPSPQPFSPDNDGVDDELLLSIKVENLAPLESWSMKIADPTGVPFKVFSGKGIPAGRILWDGLSDSGELVQAAEDYPYLFEVRDRLGNTGVIKGSLAVDVLVIREGDRLKIKISSINFPANSADLELVSDPEKKAKNARTMKRLAEILDKFRTYQIRIEGHANNTSWWDASKAAKEDAEELIPLSSARAEAVKKALVSLGLDAGRISTTGLGGKEPVVPFKDTVNNWKNRRVEFILIRK